MNLYVIKKPEGPRICKTCGKFTDRKFKLFYELGENIPEKDLVKKYGEDAIIQEVELPSEARDFKNDIRVSLVDKLLEDDPISF